MDLELTPASGLRTVLPTGTVISARFREPESGWEPWPWMADLTIAWQRDGPGAARVVAALDKVAATILGADALAQLRSGEVPEPLRDGDALRPEDPRLRGMVFAELSGAFDLLLDARRKVVRPLDPRNPLHLELVGPGAQVRVQATIFAALPRRDRDAARRPARRSVHIQLANAIGVMRGPPGWETWEPDVVSLVRD